MFVCSTTMLSVAAGQAGEAASDMVVTLRCSASCGLVTNFSIHHTTQKSTYSATADTSAHFGESSSWSQAYSTRCESEGSSVGVLESAAMDSGHFLAWSWPLLGVVCPTQTYTGLRQRLLPRSRDSAWLPRSRPLTSGFCKSGAQGPSPTGDGVQKHSRIRDERDECQPSSTAGKGREGQGRRCQLRPDHDDVPSHPPAHRRRRFVRVGLGSSPCSRLMKVQRNSPGVPALQSPNFVAVMLFGSVGSRCLPTRVIVLTASVTDRELGFNAFVTCCLVRFSSGDLGPPHEVECRLLPSCAQRI